MRAWHVLWEQYSNTSSQLSPGSGSTCLECTKMGRENLSNNKVGTLYVPLSDNSVIFRGKMFCKIVRPVLSPRFPEYFDIFLY